jgi:hypothetical protein
VGAEAGGWVGEAASVLSLRDALVGVCDTSGFGASLATAGAGLDTSGPDSLRNFEHDAWAEHCEGSWVTKSSLFSSGGVRSKLELGSCDGRTGQRKLIRSVNLENLQVGNAVTCSSMFDMKDVRLNSRVAHWVAM